jgi:hypothetical protein
VEVGQVVTHSLACVSAYVLPAQAATQVKLVVYPYKLGNVGHIGTQFAVEGSANARFDD